MSVVHQHHCSIESVRELRKLMLLVLHLLAEQWRQLHNEIMNLRRQSFLPAWNTSQLRLIIRDVFMDITLKHHIRNAFLRMSLQIFGGNIATETFNQRLPLERLSSANDIFFPCCVPRKGVLSEKVRSSSNPSGWLGNGLEIILHGNKPRPELLPTLFICSFICWEVRHVTYLNHASPRQCIVCARPLQSFAQIQYVQHLGVFVMCQCREHQALFWVKVVQKSWRSVRNRGCLSTSILSSFLAWPPPLSLTLLFRQRPIDVIGLHAQLLILQVVDEQSFVGIFVVGGVYLPNRRYYAVRVVIYLRCLLG